MRREKAFVWRGRWQNTDDMIIERRTVEWKGLNWVMKEGQKKGGGWGGVSTKPTMYGKTHTEAYK